MPKLPRWESINRSSSKVIDQISDSTNEKGRKGRGNEQKRQINPVFIIRMTEIYQGPKSRYNKMAITILKPATAAVHPLKWSWKSKYNESFASP